ncbi:MAG: O-antigen ligase family protein [Planctomycetaceae bacterium]
MPRPDRMNRTASEPPTAASPSSAWLFVIGLLLAARYLQPTEAVVFGETLWQAELWLAASAVWCWMRFRSGHATFRWSLINVLMWGLVLGHAVSTVPVFLEGGDRRAAVNVVWEWAGLAATCFLIRQVFVGDTLRRPLLVFAAVMISIAALGVWQHHVSQPQTANRYDSLRSEEATLTAQLADGEATESQRRRLTTVHEELAAFGVPGDAAARKRWEDRIKFSTEPFGTFGLANTLGGLLAAALPLLFASLRGGVRPLVARVGLIAATGCVLYCLILTKSRTAWVGLVVGSLAAIALQLIRRRVARRMLWTGVGSFAAIVLLLATVYAAGGIDRQVFSESPKSLQYRLDYWTGAFRVLSERPLLGTGPANFRSHYLEHRVPGASEEIASPHNLLLDVWVAGGLLSLLMILALLGYAIGQIVRASPRDFTVEEPATVWTPLETGAVVAFPVVVAIYFLGGDGIDWRLLAIAPISALAHFCLIRSNTIASLVVGAGAGFLALIVHLFGADGIEFPAVVQTLLLFVAVVDRPRESSPRSVALLPAVGFGGLTVACLLTGVAPVLNGGALTSRGERLARDGDPSAERVLSEAAAADSLALRPVVLLAELATLRARSTSSRADLENATRRWEAVLAMEPRDLHARRQLASLLMSYGDSKLAVDASDLLTRAVELSPTDASLRVEAAVALEAADRPAAATTQAAAALNLDDLNRAAGHTDLMFDAATRARVDRLATIGQSPPEP